MSRFKRGNEVYVRTGIELPETLRNTAREMRIGLSKTLTEALKNKIEEERGNKP
jgi:post-segregation antitoxin (ccd killing protein)